MWVVNIGTPFVLLQSIACNYLRLQLKFTLSSASSFL